MKRRQFIQSTLALGATATLGTIAGCGGRGSEPQAPLPFNPGQPLPWTNWAGNQACVPQWRYAPANEDELISALKVAQGVIRPVGAGHSFSAVTTTDDSMISTDLLTGLVSHDPVTLQATVRAGTRLNALGPLLAPVNQALPNMPDMDYPSLGGALANAVHGTGVDFQSMSAYVTGLKLATVGGDLVTCSAEKNPDIFQAALTHVGALGVVSEYTLQNQAPFELTEVNGIAKVEDVFDNMEQLCRENRHFECYLVPYSTLCSTVTTNIRQPGDAAVGEDDPDGANTLRSVFEATTWIPGIGSDLYDFVLSQAFSGTTDMVRTGPSHVVFGHPRLMRFREMEYTVPAELGVTCAREILATIKSKGLGLSFPIEFRYVKADDIWLSMFEGQDGCTISIHQYGDLDYKAPFAEIEKIFWKYGGRPHWGKIHTMTAAALAQIYPRHWQDFHEVRRALDPTGKLMNSHLRSIFEA